jgi:hypothetical protein
MFGSRLVISESTPAKKSFDKLAAVVQIYLRAAFMARKKKAGH